MPMSEAQRTLVEAQGFYLTGEDNLRVTTFGALAGVVLAIEGRRVDEGGTIVPFAERHVPNSDYSAKTTVHQIGAGTLLNAHVRVTAGTVLRGHVFVLLEVVRGLSGAIQPLATLLQGYVSGTARLAWPGSVIETSVGGAGRLRSITGTDPAAGVEISETVPAGVRWRLLGFVYALTTDATVANRTSSVFIDDGVNTLYKVGYNFSQVASTVVRYQAGAFGTFGLIEGLNYVGMLPADTLLSGGYRVRTATTNLQAGDNYGAPQYLVEEFIE